MSVTQITVESTNTLATYTLVKRVSACAIEVKPDAKSTCGNARNQLRQNIDFSHGTTAHECKHSAKGYSRRFPGEGVDRTKPPNAVRYQSSTSDARWPAKVVKNQRDVAKVEGLDDCCKSPRGSFE